MQRIKSRGRRKRPREWEDISAKLNNGEELDHALRVITNDQVREDALIFFKKVSIRFEGLKEDIERDSKLLEKAFDSEFEFIATSRSGGPDPTPLEICYTGANLRSVSYTHLTLPTKA